MQARFLSGSKVRATRASSIVVAGAEAAPQATSPLRMGVDEVSYVVGLPVPFRRRGEDAYVAQRGTASRSEAAETWARDGEGWARAVEAQRVWAREALAAARAGRDAPIQPRYAVSRSRLLSFGLGHMGLVLLSFNALALLLGRAADGGPRRRARA